jgi:hypothetical protein
MKMPLLQSCHAATSHSTPRPVSRFRAAVAPPPKTSLLYVYSSSTMTHTCILQKKLFTKLRFIS